MPFVLSSGVVDRVRPSVASSLGMGIPSVMQLGQDHFTSYERLWKTQPALRTVVEFLGRVTAELPLDVYERTDDDSRRKTRDHALSKLLNDPWPGSKWTKYRLLNWTVQEWCIYNSAIWIKGQAPNGKRGVLPVPRRYIQPIGENLFFPEAYRLTGTRGYRDLDPDQVVHFWGYNPEDPRDGWSPVETLRQVLAEEWEASRYRESMWRNGARISGYITRGEKAPRWSDTARERFKAEWSSYSSEMAAGKTPVLEDGMQWNEGGITPRDAQYVEARQLTQREVAMAFHIDPAMIGMSENANQSSMAELRKMLYADALGPLLEMLQQDIENQLLPDVYGGAAGNVYVEFNLRKKMQGSFEEQAAAVSASVGGPWMTRNEARAMFNLPDLDEAEELITPLNVTAGGLANPRDTAPDNPSNEESNGQPASAGTVARRNGTEVQG
ncbi:MAG: phage portal protein [Propionibacteriaceae bacterium]